MAGRTNVPDVWLVPEGHGPRAEYVIAVRLGDAVVHIDADAAHELAARLILLARIVDPEGVQ